MGMPLLLGVGFEFIDPMAFDDPVTGKRLLYWGSGFQPIKVQELSEDRMSFAPASAPTDLVWPNPVKAPFPRLVEAAWVIQPRRFLLSLLFGRQLLRARRRIWRDGRAVAKRDRAVRDAGGGARRAAQPDAEQERRWLAPGHNSIVTDKAARLWIVYHAIDVNRPRQRQEDEINSRRILLIDRIEWRDGWPFVGTPSEDQRSAPIT